jgi:IS30 family transposase
MRISHECIYAWIYVDKESGGKWYKRLRQSHRKRRKRYGSSEKRGRIVNRKGIEERPGIVDRRERIGDWEGDTIEGAKGSGYIVTCVERKSRITLLAKLPEKRAESLNQGTKRVFKKHSDILRLTLTVDNGKEFAGHEYLGKTLGVDVYFARPYHAWERGLSENTNGLIRQFIPKGMNIGNISHQFVAKIGKLLNNRPRKCLNYLTPIEVLNKSSGVALQN